MSSFTSTFGNSPVSPSDVAFAAYNFSTSLTLYWPAFSYGQTDVAARFMNLTATANSLNVYMPDATLVSVGYDVIIFNAGADTFNVVNFGGGAIATIAAGQTYYIILSNNSTQNGTWQVVQFGVGTGSAVASALAGAGLLASGGLLETNTLATTISSSTTLTSSARAILQVWNGGSGTVTLPGASSVGNGFFFPFANDGSGSVTIAPTGADQIDGMSTSVFTQTQSAFIVSTGTAWFTVGKGLQNNFSVTVLNLNVAGSSNITETSSQAQNIIQQYTGLLTGNINVIVPATPQIYYIYNNTTGAYTLTVKTPSGTGITVPQGTNTLLYCDGTNVVGAFTSSIGTSVTLPVGSAGSPTLNFQGSTNTGLYSPTANQISISAGGYEVTNFVSSASSVNYLQFGAAATGNYPYIAAEGSNTNVGIDYISQAAGSHNFLTGGGAQFYISNVANAVNLLNVQGAATTVAPQFAVSGTDTNIGISYVTKGTGVHAFTGSVTGAFIGNVTGNLTGNVTGNVTGSVTGNVTGNISGTAPAGSLTGTTLASNVVNASLNDITPTGGTFAVNGVINCVQSVPGGTFFAFLTNSATGANTFANFQLETGTTNSTLQMFLADNAGSPTATIALGSAVSSLTLPNNTLTVTQSAGNNSTRLATTAYVDVNPKTAKAWCVFTGSTGSILASNNIASITRNSTGDYTVAFSTAMSSANYSVLLQAGGGTTQVANIKGSTTPTTGGFEFVVFINTATPSAVDVAFVSLLVFSN